MSENSISDIDCNDLLNEIGLGGDENKDGNNKKETKKRKKVRSHKTSQQTKSSQPQPNKNKTPLVNLSEFISSKKSDFELDDDFSENNLSNLQKNALEISNDKENVQETTSEIPQNISTQISTDYDDIRSYSSAIDNINIKTDEKKDNENINEQEININEDQQEIENTFHVDSDSDNDKKEKKADKKQKNDEENEIQSSIKDKKLSSNEDNTQNKVEAIKNEENTIKKEENTSNQKRSKRNTTNKNRKNVTRINLSKFLDFESQNNNSNNKNLILEEATAKINKPLDENDINDIPLETNIKKNPNKVKNVLLKGENKIDNKLTHPASDIEQRISDYLNLSIKKVISDFTAELTSLLTRADSFDEIVKQYISDFKRNIYENINFINNNSKSQNFSFSSNIAEISSSTDAFKDLFKEIDSFIPFNPEKSLLALTECQTRINSTKNFINGKIAPLISEMRKEVNKSTKAVKLKVKKFKLHRQKFLIYDKLFDLENRELEYQIENRISEIKRKGTFYPRTSSPKSPSISFFEEDSITERIREFSMSPSKDELVKELGTIIKLLKIRRNKTTKKMNLNFSITEADSLSISNLSTSYFPISPTIKNEFSSPYSMKQYYYSKVLKDINSFREESRSLWLSYQGKIQEFCSASSLLLMEYQSHLLRQQQAVAASISLLQTNQQNYFSKTINPVSIPSNTTTMNNTLNDNINYNRNSRTSDLLQIADENDVINEELLFSLRQQADEMNRKMVNDVNSTTAFIKKISRGTRRHSARHHHHRHSRIEPISSLQKGKLELSSDISLSNMSDDDKRKNSRSSLVSQKLPIKKREKSVQDLRRRKSHNKH